MPIENPYAGTEAAGEWLRGNLHAHTTRSDGAADPQSVLDHYANAGYDFLALTDHDILTGPEEYADLEDRGLVLLPGNEISANGPHLLHVGCEERVEPDADRSDVVDAASASGLLVANHPNWGDDFAHCPQSALERWEGYDGIEIYNGVIRSHPGSPLATDRWDQLLSDGRRIRGYATDDSHRPANVATAWTVVHVTERTPGAVLEALRRGRCYASTGVEITGVHAVDDAATVRTADADRIVAVRDGGQRFAAADGRSLSVPLPGDATYVRFECYGSGEAVAWTQPLFLD